MIYGIISVQFGIACLRGIFLLPRVCVGRSGNAGEKPISPAGNRFDKSRGIRVVVEHGTNLSNAEVQALLKVYKCAIAPDHLLQFFASNNLSRAACQSRKNLERLRTQFEATSVLSELALIQVQFKRTELQLVRVFF